MKHARTVCAFLLALAMLVFGGNYFLEMFPLPEAGDSDGEQLLQSMRDGGLMSVIAASHVLVGLLLLLPRTRFFGGVMQLPMSLGIAAFHATMLPEGLVPAIVLLVLNLVVICTPRLKPPDLRERLMAWVSGSRDIDAPVHVVFRTVSDIREFAKAVPAIQNYEFLSEVQTGLGTRFRETRVMNGREDSTELEVTEYELDHHVRMVADSHGTVWDTVFRVRESDGRTTLSLDMDARPHRLLSKIMNPLIRGMVQKAIEGDLDALKEYCEA